MKVLAIDTSSEIGGISILDYEKNQFYNKRIENTSKVAESIYTHLENSLHEFGCQLADIDIFSTVVGPGSFTGLRVSLSVLKSFALALRKPLLGIETFKVMAYASTKIRDLDNIFVIGNARRNDIFISLYGKDLSEKEPIKIVPAVELAELLKDENIVVVYRDVEVKEFIPQGIDHIQIDKDVSSDCADLTTKLYSLGNNLSLVSDIEPVYVRNDIAKIKM